MKTPMELIAVASGFVTVTLNQDELRALNNSMGEAMLALDDWDFPIRMGVELAEVRLLMAELKVAKAKMLTCRVESVEQE